MTASEIKAAYGNTPAAVIAAMKAAGKPLDEIVRALVTAFGLDATSIAQLLKQADYNAQAVLGALKDVFHLGVDSLMHIGKSVFNLTTEVAAQIMRALDFTMKQIAHALKSVYDIGESAVKAALHAAGWAWDEITGFFKGIADWLGL